jgi:hypothetical protein
MAPYLLKAAEPEVASRRQAVWSLSLFPGERRALALFTTTLSLMFTHHAVGVLDSY